MLTWDTLVPLLVKFYNSTVRYQNQNESVNSALSGYYDRPTADEPTTPDQQTNQETKRSDHRKFTHREQPIANELKIRAPLLSVLGGEDDPTMGSVRVRAGRMMGRGGGRCSETAHVRRL